MSVGRGTGEAFQRFGAPWLRADTVSKLLADLGLTGVRFKAERFTPSQPGDSKYPGQSIPGVRIEVLDRDLVQPSRVGAAILWAINKLNGDSLVIRARIDERMGSAKREPGDSRGNDPMRSGSTAARVVESAEPAKYIYR